MVRLAVAGEPTTLAVTVKVVNGVTCVGKPIRVPLESSERPVPVRAGAVRMMDPPDAAVALN
jgi:hypothetical protein